MKLQPLSLQCLFAVGALVAPLAAWESVWTPVPGFTQSSVIQSPSGLAVIQEVREDSSGRKLRWHLTTDGRTCTFLGESEPQVEWFIKLHPFGKGFVGIGERFYYVSEHGVVSRTFPPLPNNRPFRQIQVDATKVRYFDDADSALTIHESSDGVVWLLNPAIPTNTLPRYVNGVSEPYYAERSFAVTEDRLICDVIARYTQVISGSITWRDALNNPDLREAYLNQPTENVPRVQTDRYQWRPDLGTWKLLESTSVIEEFGTTMTQDYALRQGTLTFIRQMAGTPRLASFAATLSLATPTFTGEINTPVLQSGPQARAVEAPLAPLPGTVWHGKARDGVPTEWWQTVDGQTWYPLLGAGPVGLNSSGVAVLPGVLLASAGGQLYRVEHPRWAAGWHDASGWSYVPELGWIWLKYDPWCYVLKDGTWAMAYGDNPAFYWLWTPAKGWRQSGNL